MTGAKRGGFSPAQAQVIWVLWATYGAFYFCRSNISAAIPGMEAELGLSKTEIGTILGGLKLAYGAGQLINGQLAERVSPRLLLAIGMFTSAALNAVFGLATGFYFLLFVWAANGYFQALGWAPSMRVAGNWFPPAVRGRAIALIATGYLLAGGAVALVAGWSAELFGWRGAHIVPAALFAAVGFFTLLTLRVAPPPQPASESGSGPASGSGSAAAAPGGWLHTLAVTVVNPRLWLIAVALGLVDACRYGFLDWGITHLMEVQGGGVGKNALKFAVLPLGGVAGALTAGWVSDRVFGGRRIPVLIIMLVLLAGLAVLYNQLVQVSLAGSIFLLAFIGFCIYGPQVLLVGPAAMDMARAGRSAAAVGFVNLFGYLGAFAGDRTTGALADQHGWQAAVYFWAGCAVAAAIVLAPLWAISAARSGRR
jgi:sugar phosphate permease